MSLALYRRYRPETFAEVIGQEHVTGPLQQALRNNRVNHAYLFSGPRGCGKTTSARILARCLNCEQGPTPTPCGECRSCVDLARGGPGSIDVIEIDAASHGGVDDTRDLREKAFFAPASSRYKIYIIDEAHMVSTAGFNALLKVVEEPPEHLKFIFATTEPEKVIGTIRSRTHHYPFRLVPPGVLRDYLADVCGRESIQVEDSVYPLVVRAGAGSVRDSMSVMDQLLAGADERGVTYTMATSLLGYTDAALLDEIVDAFAQQDGATVFGIVDRVIEGGHDPRRFVADLLERLRDLVILSAVPDAGEKGLIDAPADRVALLEQQAQRFGSAELSRAADIVNTGLTEMRGATSPRLQLELICARVMLPSAFTDETSTQARLEKLERRSTLSAGVAAVAGGTGVAGTAGTAPAPVFTEAAVPAPVPATTPAPMSPPVVAPAPAAAPGHTPGAWPVTPSFGQAAPQPAPAPATPAAAPTPAPAPTPAAPAAPAAPSPEASGASATQIRQMWPQILDAVKGRRRVTWMLLQQAQVAGFDGGALQLAFEHAGTRDGFVNGGHDEILRQALQESLGVNWKVECLIGPTNGGSGGGATGNGGFGGGGGVPPRAGGGGGSFPPAAQAAQTARSAAPAPFGQSQGQVQGQSPAAPASSLSSPPTNPQVHAPAPAPIQPQTQAPAPAPAQRPSAPAQMAPAPSAPMPSAPPPYDGPDDDDMPPPFDPDEDIPEYTTTSVSGPDLIIRELGATVIEEIERNR
ncbi:DNA polymerase III subunit gamma and tau [Streptacidiphilus fuscans]|uniref:DNA polymerase III subunit gamma/tau n=1 Tax=Streptacidiphilus fuscans TaxID=2789292 RepID=A0A931B5U6_9ACTN|nr:DNA polymerase III subunit gamma and tau [Streptacidiphilus fuscans]MBF9070736.1 DNA polymerase III subunit gamma and tau [Streptacidiphilus fuscans]